MSLDTHRLLILIIFVRWTQAGIIQTFECSGPYCAPRLKQMGVDVRFLQDNCKCDGGTCRCCFEGNWPQFNISREFCMNAAFISDDLELQVNATLDENNLGEFVLSGRNPPPLCFQVPLPVPIPLSVCVRAKEIYPEGSNLHFCVDMMMRFIAFDFLTLHLNCMWIGTNGVQLVGQRGIFSMK